MMDRAELVVGARTAMMNEIASGNCTTKGGGGQASDIGNQVFFLCSGEDEEMESNRRFWPNMTSAATSFPEILSDVRPDGPIGGVSVDGATWTRPLLLGETTFLQSAPIILETQNFAPSADHWLHTELPWRAGYDPAIHAELNRRRTGELFPNVLPAWRDRSGGTSGPATPIEPGGPTAASLVVAATGGFGADTLAGGGDLQTIPAATEAQEAIQKTVSEEAAQIFSDLAADRPGETTDVAILLPGGGSPQLPGLPGGQSLQPDVPVGGSGIERTGVFAPGTLLGNAADAVDKARAELDEMIRIAKLGKKYGEQATRDEEAGDCLAHERAAYEMGYDIGTEAKARKIRENSEKLQEVVYRSGDFFENLTGDRTKANPLERLVGGPSDYDVDGDYLLDQKFDIETTAAGGRDAELGKPKDFDRYAKENNLRAPRPGGACTEADAVATPASLTAQSGPVPSAAAPEGLLEFADMTVADDAEDVCVDVYEPTARGEFGLGGAADGGSGDDEANLFAGIRGKLFEKKSDVKLTSQQVNEDGSVTCVYSDFLNFDANVDFALDWSDGGLLPEIQFNADLDFSLYEANRVKHWSNADGKPESATISFAVGDAAIETELEVDLAEREIDIEGEFEGAGARVGYEQTRYVSGAIVTAGGLIDLGSVTARAGTEVDSLKRPDIDAEAGAYVTQVKGYVEAKIPATELINDPRYKEAAEKALRDALPGEEVFLVIGAGGGVQAIGLGAGKYTNADVEEGGAEAEASGKVGPVSLKGKTYIGVQIEEESEK